MTPSVKAIVEKIAKDYGASVEALLDYKLRPTRLQPARREMFARLYHLGNRPDNNLSVLSVAKQVGTDNTVLIYHHKRYQSEWLEGADDGPE